jgi:hypothetical protein
VGAIDCDPVLKPGGAEGADRGYRGQSRFSRSFAVIYFIPIIRSALNAGRTTMAVSRSASLNPRLARRQGDMLLTAKSYACKAATPFAGIARVAQAAQRDSFLTFPHRARLRGLMGGRRGPTRAGKFGSGC